MNPKAAGLIVLGIIVVVTILAILFVWWVSHQAGVRRTTYKEMQERLARQEKELDLATNALDDISAESDNYRDFQNPESILAVKIRERIRQYNTDKREQKKR